MTEIDRESDLDEDVKVKIFTTMSCGGDQRESSFIKKKIEFYVSDLNPEWFGKLKLPSDVDIELTLGNHILERSDLYFYHLFHEVLYGSIKATLNLDQMKFIKELKLLMGLLLAFLSVIFVVMNLTLPFKVALFGLIIGVSIGTYLVCLKRPVLGVTHLKRKTQFALINEGWLDALPALYVVDEKKVYMGANFLKPGDHRSFYQVMDPEEASKLITLYRAYKNASSIVDDESLISYYFEVLQGLEVEVQTQID